MICYVEMIDTSTGEIIYNKELAYSFSMTSNDVGFGKVMEILKNACKGARITRSPIQLRFMFHEAINNLSLPFDDINEFKTPYEVKPF